MAAFQQIQLASVTVASADAARVQFQRDTAIGVASVAISFSVTPTAGNLVVVVIPFYNNGGGTSVASVADNQGNTYTQALSPVVSGDAVAVIWYSNNVAASGTFTVTVNWTDIAWSTPVIIEYSGAADASVADNTNSGTGTGTAVSTSAVTPTQAAIYVACMTHAGGFTTITPTGAPWNQVTEEENFDVMSVLDAITTGAQTPSWTLGGSMTWAAAVATFKD